MNIPKEIIEKAIEGGYMIGRQPLYVEMMGGVSIVWNDGKRVAVLPNEIGIDCTFWKALQHDLGWKENLWLPYAEDFLHLIFTEQPTEAFWQSLLDSGEKQ